MAEFHPPPSADAMAQQRDRQGSILSLSSTARPGSSAAHNGGAPVTAPNGGGAVKSPTEPATLPADVEKQVKDVLSSEIGVATLLNRLKQSISSAREFAAFLKKRGSLEEEHATGLKKLCRMTQENMRRAEHRQGSFALAYDEMMHINERVAENGMQFASSLYQMHDDLFELAAIAERSRKGWKTNGLAAEQRVAEIEAAMRKSKAKYDALAEEYDRARTGDVRQSGGKMSLFKGPKSAAQHEEELLRKVQGADQDYSGRVQALQTERAELIARTRPDTVRALQELVKETDSGLTLQMQKFASFSEKLLLSNGLSISPIKGQADAAHQPRSLRDVVTGINNERDLNDYLVAHHSKLPSNYGEPKYERNPVLNPQMPIANPQQNASMPHMGGPMSPQGQYPVQPLGPGQGPPLGPGQGPPLGMQGRTNTGGFGPGAGSPQGFMPGAIPTMSGAQPQRPSSQQHNRSFSQSAMMNQPGIPPQQQPQNLAMRNSAVAIPQSKFNTQPMMSQGPPQLGALPFQSAPPPSQQQPPPQGAMQGPQAHQRGASMGGPNPLQQHPPNPQAAVPPGKPYQQQGMPGAVPAPAAPSQPVFGVSLDQLYQRDSLAVPMVVYQCIQAVDLFGLGVEGIYRQSGSLQHIMRLKSMFDTDSSNPALDFRNPENFFHDVNGVTGLLKQFCRDLPDPLLTMAAHGELIKAAKQEDDNVRRDSLHAIINTLPDPNYATLRALALHLHRVMDSSHVNRMNSHNLAVIFGPTLMGTDPSTAIADAGWQIKVVDTILQNTYQIFDDD